MMSRIKLDGRGSGTGVAPASILVEDDMICIESRGEGNVHQRCQVVLSVGAIPEPDVCVRFNRICRIITIQSTASRMSGARFNSQPDQPPCAVFLNQISTFFLCKVSSMPCWLEGTTTLNVVASRYLPSI